MVQVLPYVPSFGERLAGALGNAAGNLGQAYIEGKRYKETQNRDNEIINQLSSPNLSPMDAIALVSKLSADKQKNVSTMLGPLLKEKAKSNEKMALLEKLMPELAQNQGKNAALLAENQGGVSPEMQSGVSPIQNLIQQVTTPQQEGGGINGLPNEKLELLSAFPELRPFAENVLNRRRHEEKIEAEERRHKEDVDERKFKDTRDFEYKRAGPILEEADLIRRTMPNLRNSINTLETSIQSGDLGTLSGDYLANVTGIEGFRSGKGALFLTAGKDFFLNNIGRVGNRPNQWVEQQLVKMQPEIGRSREANESVVEFMKFKVDTDEAFMRTIDQLSDEYKKTLGYVPGDIGVIADKAMKPYVEKRQKQLAYKLRQIHEQEAGKETLSKMEKVPKGTPLTLEKAKALLNYFKDTKDPQERMKKAEETARKLGYEIVGEEIYGEQ